MIERLRRLRKSEAIRDLVRETRLHIDELVYPVFIVEGENQRQKMDAMPGIYRFSVDTIGEEMDEITNLGINHIMIFGVPNHKDCFASESYSKDGIVQRAVREIKRSHPHINVITDVCMCQYTDHGHCGILTDSGVVDNDKTIDYIAKIALSHVEAGADMVAPSDMMDGRIAKIRKVLDENGYQSTPIMAYSAKYASNFYGPFREAAESAPAFGDRKTYQMDPANSDEAMRECRIDIEEGADIIMVKPALSYLDIIRRVRDNFNMPIAAYNVSGEYSMLKYAVLSGLMKEEVIFESVLSIKRAGANIIITYFAKDIARKLLKNMSN